MNGKTNIPDGTKLQPTDDVAENAKQVDADYKAKHDALYGKYTARAENELTLSKKLFKSNPEEFATFSEGIKTKIVKEEYGYDTLEEAVLVLGEDFYKADVTSDEDGDDVMVRIKQLEKDKKIADYKARKSLVDNKLDLYIAKNSLDDSLKDIIKGNFDMLSDSFDINTRIEKAVALTKAEHGKDVTFGTTTSGGSINIKQATTTEVPRNSELGKLFGNKS